MKRKSCAAHQVTPLVQPLHQQAPIRPTRGLSIEPNINDTDEEILMKRAKIQQALNSLRKRSSQTPAPMKSLKARPPLEPINPVTMKPAGDRPKIKGYQMLQLNNG